MKLLTTLTLGASLKAVNNCLPVSILHFKVQGIDTSSAQATARMLPLNEQTVAQFFVVTIKQPVQGNKETLIENGIKILRSILRMRCRCKSGRPRIH